MRAGEELGGPAAAGKPGDLVLENDEVAFVIAAPGAVGGGDLVDAADARARVDELDRFAVAVAVGAGAVGAGRGGVAYERAASRVGPEGGAEVDLEGRLVDAPAAIVRTRYALAASDRALLVETAIENRGAATIAALTVGDRASFGHARPFAPGKAPGFVGAARAPFVGAVGGRTSYALAMTDGDVDATLAADAIETTALRGATLAPGANVQVARVVVVGARPDTASVVAELTKSAGQPVGALAVEIAAPPAADGGAPTAPGAWVALGRNGVDVLTVALPPATAGAARVVVEVPPGPWDVAYVAAGGARGPAARAIVAPEPAAPAVARVAAAAAGP